MRITMRQFTALSMILAQIFCAPVRASIPLVTDRRIDFSLVTNYSILDSARSRLPVVPRVLAIHDIEAEDLAMQIPPSLQAQSNAQTVGTWDQNQATSQANSALGRQVLNQNLNRMLQENRARGGTLGKAASSVENTMQTKVSFGDKQPESIHHNVNMKLDVAGGQAIMDYTGYAHAQVSYGVGPNAAMRTAVYQKLAAQTDLVVDHTTNRMERVDRVSVSFGF